MNVTLRENKKDEGIKDNEVDKKTDYIADEDLLRHRREDNSLDLEQYTKAINDEVEYEIPKVRNGRRVSGLGYAKSPHDPQYKYGCNDGVNGIPTVNPSSKALFMTKLK